jgi:glutamine amidotransferase
VRNTHPFLQDGRIFAHNGMIEALDVVEERLRQLGTWDLVLGQTDSERVFALITAGIRAHDGDVAAGIVDALRWLADNVPVYAVNILLCMGTQMWALRYPDTHQLFMLDRRVDGVPDFDMSTSRIHARSQTLTERSSVVFATEPMDDDPRWCLLDPGELVYVDAGLNITRTMVLPDPPRHLVRRDDLSQPVFRAQHALPGTRHRP